MVRVEQGWDNGCGCKAYININVICKSYTISEHLFPHLLFYFISLFAVQKGTRDETITTPTDDTLINQPSSSSEKESVRDAKKAKYGDVVSTVLFSCLHSLNRLHLHLDYHAIDFNSLIPFREHQQ